MDIQESWLKNFKEQNYIKNSEETININFFYIYVNRQNTLEIIRQGPTYILQSNTFDKKDLIQNIKENSYVNKQKYKLLSIMKYNIDVDSNNLEDFLNKDTYEKYTQLIKNIDGIEFTKSTKMFNDLNSIFIIYHENASPSLTKKIKLKPTSNKKTKHKRYKEIKK
tara:strand:- start:36 stop:533 length:498 start_codon:yes stop_codon:yes gene_type:complete